MGNRPLSPDELKKKYPIEQLADSTIQREAESKYPLRDKLINIIISYSNELAQRGSHISEQYLLDALHLIKAIIPPQKFTEEMEGQKDMFSKARTFEIDFSGHVKARLVFDGELKVTEAMNGYGDAMELNKIIVTPSKERVIDFETVQSELNKQFDNIRMSAEHTLFLNQNFEVRKRHSD